MKTTLGLLAYLAAGSTLLASIGRSRSWLQWDGAPTPARRLLTVAAWPVILVMVMRGAFDRDERSRDEVEGV